MNQETPESQDVKEPPVESVEVDVAVESTKEAVELPPEQAPTTVPKLSRYERRELAAADALRSLIRDLYLEQYRKPAEKAQAFSMQLNIEVDPLNNWALSFAPNLQEQVRGTVGDVEAEWGMFQSGRVFDFHADTARSDKATPPSATMVFAGYDSFGGPTWCEFSQLLIDMKDPRVDKLYTSHSPALNVVQFGKELKSDQLSSYGKASKTYSLLGQVAFGFLKVARNKQQLRALGEKLALTFQMVETRNSRGEFDLRINTIAGVYTADEIEDLLTMERNAWIFTARESAQRRLDDIRAKALRARKAGDQDAYNEAMKGIGGVLRTMSKSLDRGNRQDKRRTSHAVKRKGNAARPTNKAFEDAKDADVAMMYHDAQHDSIVILAKPNRVHAFSKQGKHITSFTIKPDSVDHRKRKDRWVAIPEADAVAFKQAIAQSATVEDRAK